MSIVQLVEGAVRDDLGQGLLPNLLVLRCRQILEHDELLVVFSAIKVVHLLLLLSMQYIANLMLVVAQDLDLHGLAKILILLVQFVPFFAADGLTIQIRISAVNVDEAAIEHSVERA